MRSATPSTIEQEDDTLDTDHGGVNRAFKLWLSVIEERHTDQDRKKASTLEEFGDRETED